MRPSAISRRYAQAAFAIAGEDGNVDTWITELSRVVERYNDDANLREYFRDPNVSSDEQLQAVDVLFGDLQPHVANLVRELVSRHRFHLLPAVLQELNRMEREARGVEDAYITVARPISQDEGNTIAQHLAASTGKTVQAHVAVDPALLGGIVVRIGDRVYDSSVATRLQRLRQDLTV